MDPLALPLHHRRVEHVEPVDLGLPLCLQLRPRHGLWIELAHKSENYLLASFHLQGLHLTSNPAVNPLAEGDAGIFRNQRQSSFPNVIGASRLRQCSNLSFIGCEEIQEGISEHFLLWSEAILWQFREERFSPLGLLLADELASPLIHGLRVLVEELLCLLPDEELYLAPFIPSGLDFATNTPLYPVLEGNILRQQFSPAGLQVLLLANIG
mmetsp:Transcript_47848/g.104131  ORF Transcript_47848/g.104131 Transcript_47848/m.104131 type:complete len:211 (+) Transcript_47848:245-877(+)